MNKMKSVSFKLSLIISIFLNILLIVLLLNSSIENHKDYGTGDTAAYHSFLYGLNQFEQHLDDAGQHKKTEEVMSSLINGNERLKRSINSFTIFKSSLEQTELNSQYIDILLSQIDEGTFSLMVNYSLDKVEDTDSIEQIKSDVNNLINLLPQEYNVDNKKEFIEAVNQLSLSK